MIFFAIALFIFILFTFISAAAHLNVKNSSWQKKLFKAVLWTIIALVMVYVILAFNLVSFKG